MSNLPSKNSYSRQFFRYFFFLEAIAFVTAILLPSYFGYASSRSLSTIVEDGWCNSRFQGVGIHCFGDFYSMLNYVNLENPWKEGVNPYPPISLFLLKPFKSLVNNFPGTNIGLIVYLIVCIASYLYPIVYLVRKNFIDRNYAFYVLSTSLILAPFIMGLDRGNMQILFVPLIFTFCIYYLQDEDNKLLLIIILLTTLKPQFVLLSLIFLTNNRIWLFLKASFSAIVVFLISFMLYPRNLISNIFDWYGQIDYYQNFTNAGSPDPVNLSLANTWSLFWRIIFAEFPNLTTKDPNGRWPYYSTLITIVITMLIVITIKFALDGNNKICNLYFILCLPILLPNVTYAYYLCILIPLFTILLSTEIVRFEKNHSDRNNLLYICSSQFQEFLEPKFTRYLFSLTHFSLFIPWVIPWKLFPKFQNLRLSEMSINWVPGQMFLSFFFLTLILNAWIKYLGNYKIQIPIRKNS